jgi:hypothetical protein
VDRSKRKQRLDCVRSLRVTPHLKLNPRKDEPQLDAGWGLTDSFSGDFVGSRILQPFQEKAGESDAGSAKARIEGNSRANQTLGLPPVLVPVPAFLSPNVSRLLHHYRCKC